MLGFLRGHPLLLRWFEVCPSGNVTDSDRRAGTTYLHEVEQGEIYVGLFGNEYGSEGNDRVSCTREEVNRTTAHDRYE